MGKEAYLILKTSEKGLFQLAVFSQKSQLGMVVWSDCGYSVTDKFSSHMTIHPEKHGKTAVLHTRYTATKKASEEDKEKMKNAIVTDGKGDYLYTFNYLKEAIVSRPIPDPKVLSDWRQLHAFGYSISGLKEKGKQIQKEKVGITISVLPSTDRIYFRSYVVNPKKKKEFEEFIKNSPMLCNFTAHFYEETNPLIVVLSKQDASSTVSAS